MPKPEYTSTQSLYVERWGTMNGFRAKLGSWRIPDHLTKSLMDGSITSEDPSVLGNPRGTGSIAQKLERVLPAMFFAPEVSTRWMVTDRSGCEFRPSSNPNSSTGMSESRRAAEALFQPKSKPDTI